MPDDDPHWKLTGYRRFREEDGKLVLQVHETLTNPYGGRDAQRWRDATWEDVGIHRAHEDQLGG